MPTAEVSLNAIRSNLAVIRSLVVAGTAIMPVLKADAYGHGAVPVAAALSAAGADWLAVATPAELLELRAAGISANLFLLVPPFEQMRELAAADAVFPLTDHATLDRLISWKLPRGTRLHLKTDTGLGRLGLPPARAAGLAVRAERAGFAVEGIWTHFASAEDDRHLTQLQLERFMDAVALLKAHGLEPPLKHASNSAAILTMPQAHLDLVRPGLLTYGYSPLALPNPAGARLTKALELTAPVLQSKRVQPGDGLSYNHRWRASVATNIATVRLGYADGYRRALSDRAWARARGRRLPLRGQIAMDQVLIDTGSIQLEPGEQVTFIGGSGPGADELGSLVDSNAYDILTSLGRRVKRLHSRD